MTIEKAIGKLAHLINPDYFLLSSDENNAIRLGIEAPKSVRTGRRVGLHYEAECLPGETKEVIL